MTTLGLSSNSPPSLLYVGDGTMVNKHVVSAEEAVGERWMRYNIRMRLRLGSITLISGEGTSHRR